MSPEIQVSIICLAFNHEKFIRKCLECLVEQKDVRFEIIVHDDASCDHTADIIREFETRYPDIVKPIYQKVNQYSKGVSIHRNFILPNIRGKYVAWCEGDDYWTDPDKLKKQVNVMDAHPECHLLLHKVLVVDKDGNSLNRFYPRKENPTKLFTDKEFFEHLEENVYFHTSSFFVLGEDYRRLWTNTPRFVKKSPVGDEAFIMYFASKGCVYYENEVRSHYRFESCPTSWTSGQKNSYQKNYRHFDRFAKAVLAFDRYSHHRYHKALAHRVKTFKKMNYDRIMGAEDYRKLFSPFYIGTFLKQTPSLKFILYAAKRALKN